MFQELEMECEILLRVVVDGRAPWKAGLWEKKEEVYGWVWVQENSQCSVFHGELEDLWGIPAKVCHEQ